MAQEEPKTVSAKDFDTTDITNAFDDAVAAQKAGDDDDLTAALTKLDDLIMTALGTKPTPPDDDDTDDDKDDAFDKKVAKYSK